MGARISKKQAKRTIAPAVQKSAKPAVITWLSNHAMAAFLLLVAIGTARIAATYDVFNHTIDEPAHIACGMEWLAKGVYHYEPQHPPLARIAAALGPYLAGIRSYGRSTIYNEGAAILYRDGHYDHNLTLARLGILPFFWIASLVVFVWTRRYLGDLIGVLAVLFFTLLPPVLAHAGLATTDMALTAFTGAAFLSALIWIEKPTLPHSALFGACSGLALLSKFSALPFLPAAMTAALAWHIVVAKPGVRPLLALAARRVLPFGLAAGVGCLVVWGGYRFSLDELRVGVQQVMEHNAKGHQAYLLGSISDSGWWYYYLVVLAVKTPLPFLALLLIGARNANRGVRLALAFALGILVFSCLFSRINVGVRHILPVYIGFSMVAAVGAARLLEMAPARKWAAWTLAALLCWLAGTSAFSHPDYLPYFNALAGDEPEKIVVDSDLDWGQDMKRLGKRLREAGARQVAFNPFIVAYLEAVHGFPPIQPMDPETPAPGWSAVSLTMLKGRMGPFKNEDPAKLWPEHIKPAERVGKGVLLWYFPPR